MGKCSLLSGTKETDQISAFWIKWEERVVRSVQLAFLTARSPVYRQPSGCEVFLMQILLSCFSCSPLLFQLKKRFFKVGCFKED